MRCFRTVLGISYTEHITNEEVGATITKHARHYEELLAIMKKRKLYWYGQVTRASGLSKTVLQGIVQGVRRRGKQRKKRADNIAEWTGKSFATTQALAHDRQRWRQLMQRCSAPTTLGRVKGFVIMIVIVTTRPGKIPMAQAGIELRIFRSRGRRLNNSASEAA